MHEKIMKHGKQFGQLDVEYVGTDYFSFHHKICRNRKAVNDGLCLPRFLLLDSEGRIIFHLRCLDCGFEDVLKTHFELWQVHRNKHYETKILLEKQLVKAAQKMRTLFKEHARQNGNSVPLPQIKLTR